jgi:hypothetical protein
MEKKKRKKKKEKKEKGKKNGPAAKTGPNRRVAD